MNDKSKDSKRNVVGLIVFDGERFLLLHRVMHWKGWEFPKGSIEKNELVEEAISRELYEETGIKKFRLLGEIDIVDFFDEKRKINSHVTNFLLHVSSNSKVSINNPHELDNEIVVEHDDFKWFHPSEAIKILTHENQKESLNKAINKLGLSR